MFKTGLFFYVEKLTGRFIISQNYLASCIWTTTRHTMDISGKFIQNKYHVDKQIWEDAVSYLHLAYDASPQKRPLIIRFLKNNVISKRLEDLIRFRIEVNAVSELSHRNITSIIETGELIEVLYVVMEYFPCISLHEALKNRSFTTEQTIDCVRQISSALECLHGSSIIHRDLKPANVLVDNETVKLTGFGLAHIREFNESIPFEEIKKSFMYLSPEQCGILKRPIDERSDLYSLGVIFFQLLTGTVPFEGPDICSIIHQQIARIPDPPGLRNPGVPSLLDRIVLKLLDKEPENRYQSARGLISDLDRYIAGEHEFILGLDDRITRLSYRTRLIGREREMSQLNEIVNDLASGTGSVYFIAGEGGSGKSRLIEELKSTVFANDFILAGGTCSIQSNKIPNAPIKDALDEFMVNFHNLSEEERRSMIDELQDEFGNLGEIIIKLNPTMEELLGQCPPLVALEPEREYKRFLMIVSQFILKLSDLAGGLVLVMENLQWTDEGTVNLLHELLNEINRHPLVIIGLYRDDEVTDNHVLEKFHLDIASKEVPFTRIRLDKFDAPAMNKFAAGLLMEPEDHILKISDFLFQKSGGNPFFAIELLKQLIDEGALMHNNNRWTFDESKLSTIEISASIVDIILKRINKLTGDEIDILSCASVMGEKFNMQILFKVSGLDRTEIVRIIDKSIDLQLLVDLPAWGEIGFAHDRIKEAFYGNCDAEKRKGLHLAIANAIEENNRDNLEPVIFELAHHFIEAGDSDRAIIFAFPAGIMAMGKYANEEALKYFRTALNLLEAGGHRGSTQWIRIQVNMSRVFLTIGSYDQAIEKLGEIAPIMESDIEKADIYSHICAAYLRKGDWKKCEEYAIRSGELLGERFTDNKIIIIATLAKELILLGLFSIFPRLVVRFRRRKFVEYNKLKAKFAVPVLWSYIYSNTLKFTRFTLRALNIAISKIGKSPELGMAIGGFGSILMAISRFNLALKYHTIALTMREKLNDQWGAAQSYQWLGYCHQWKGDYTASIECFEESARRFKKMGDIYEIGNSYAGLIYNYLFLADYDKLKYYLDQYYMITNQTNDFYGINEAWIYSTPYFMEKGNIDTAEWLGNAAYNYSLDTDILFTQCTSCIELGKVYLEKRDIPQSLKYLEKACDLYRHNSFLKQYTIQLFPALAEAYLYRYITAKETSSGVTKQNLQKTREYCKKSLARTKPWATYYGLALLVNAKYYAIRGRKKRAEKLFHQSIDHNKKIGRRYYLARSLYEYGLFLSQADGATGAKKNLEAAYNLFTEIGANRYVEELRSLLGIKDDDSGLTTIERRIDNERLSSVIRLAREISNISETEDLLDRILSKAVEITGAQRGSIFIANDRDQLEKKAVFSMLGYDTVIDQYSMNIIKAVYNTQSMIILGDANAIPQITDQSRSGPHSKSILSVPIKERDKTVGVCYLDNSLTSGIFTEKEANLLLTFLSHVAFAIEIEFLHRRYQSTKYPDKKALQSPLINEKIQKAVEYIHQNYAYEISREGLASHIGLHHDNLGRYFKLYQGKKMSDYINELRIKEAARKLQETDEKIIDIAFSVGFGSLRTFNKSFRDIMKISPAFYRKKRP
jgi:serine/threonine protein kinase/AraC-like DNA-binding protein